MQDGKKLAEWLVRDSAEVGHIYPFELKGHTQNEDDSMRISSAAKT